jgi:hypothetical protein
MLSRIVRAEKGGVAEVATLPACANSELFEFGHKDIIPILGPDEAVELRYNLMLASLLESTFYRSSGLFLVGSAMEYQHEAQASERLARETLACASC